MLTYTIAVDVMGGDHGPSVTIPGALAALAASPDFSVILVGDKTQMESQLVGLGMYPHPRITLHHASQTVAMDESPSQALRQKKDSSMRVAINLVSQGVAQACVSAGNTGALMATAKFVLQTIPGVDRPAILSPLPAMTAVGETYVLDLGANVECRPEHILQFAIMGSVVVRALRREPHPRVGLLNIGHEAIKGNEAVKQSANLLQTCTALNYYGFVEGDDIALGTVDVIVCDGFVGNVALKAMEGSARLIGYYLKQALFRNWWTKLAAYLISPILRDFKQRIDPACYNGASLLGLRGIVIKSHGGASVKGFSFAIKRAVLEAKNNIPAHISEEVKKLLLQEK